MVTLTVTDEQAKLIYQGLRELIEVIYDDPEIIGVDEDEYESELEADAAIMDFINTNINTIVDQINKQVKS